MYSSTADSSTKVVKHLHRSKEGIKESMMTRFLSTSKSMSGRSRRARSHRETIKIYWPSFPREARSWKTFRFKELLEKDTKEKWYKQLIRRPENLLPLKLYHLSPSESQNSSSTSSTRSWCSQSWTTRLNSFLRFTTPSSIHSTFIELIRVLGICSKALPTLTFSFSSLSWLTE